MEEEPSNGFIKTLVEILLILGILLSLFLFSYLSYRIYLDYPREAENPEILLSNKSYVRDFENNKVNQFYPNMKFNHNNISYKIEEDCDTLKKSRIIESFDILSKEVELINFYPTDLENPDIHVICSERNKPKFIENKDFFIGGEGGAKEVIMTGRYNVINEGIILLYGSPDGYKKCKFPNVEFHELLHVFGFDHSNLENSIMYPYLNSCNQAIDSSIINELKRLYNEENLPDVYFEDLKAVKKGRYLNFNTTIKNSGVIDSGNITLSVIQDGVLLETRKLESLKYGAGIFISIENLRLEYLDVKEISFVLDKENKIREIDRENNIARLRFDK
ncbi:MAG: CARDB domain-containing protein [Candidatus Pacearchaeota archaeon]|jgi:hypothetical protein